MTTITTTTMTNKKHEWMKKIKHNNAHLVACFHSERYIPYLVKKIHIDNT